MLLTFSCGFYGKFLMFSEQYEKMEFKQNYEESWWKRYAEY